MVNKGAAGRLGLGALVVLAAACGGNAERHHAPSESGSPGSVTGAGGITGILGSGGAAGTTSSGGSSAAGAAGGRQSRMVSCAHATLNYVAEESHAMPAGFSGNFDDASLELVPGDSFSYPDIAGAIVGDVHTCRSSTTFSIRLYFDGPHQGEQLYFDVRMRDVCEVTAGYSRDPSSTEQLPVDIDVKLQVWDPAIDVAAKTFMQGEFTANVAEPLGYAIGGTFSVAADHLFCLL